MNTEDRARSADLADLALNDASISEELLIAATVRACIPPAATVRACIPLPLSLTGREVVRATVTTFHGLIDGKEHIAINFATEGNQLPPLVRVHSECLTGDVFASARCDCGAQLNEALSWFGEIGGVILYLRQEGREIGLYNKIDTYLLQDQGLDTYEANCRLSFPADGRDYTVAAQMLQAMGIYEIRLLSNNPDKRKDLEAGGVVVTESISTGVFATDFNRRYLSAKAVKANHQIELH